jgi:molybdate transport system regulatory protein
MIAGSVGLGSQADQSVVDPPNLGAASGNCARGPLCCHSKVWFDRDGRVALSEWRVELLEAVDATGSLTKAAELMHVPYRTAWHKLNEMEESLGVKLHCTQSGGHDGGSSELTPEAREIIARFRRVTRGLEDLIETRFRVEFGDLLAPD